MGGGNDSGKRSGVTGTAKEKGPRKLAEIFSRRTTNLPAVAKPIRCEDPWFWTSGENPKFNRRPSVSRNPATKSGDYTKPRESLPLRIVRSSFLSLFPSFLSA